MVCSDGQQVHSLATIGFDCNNVPCLWTLRDNQKRVYQDDYAEQDFLVGGVKGPLRSQERGPASRRKAKPLR